MIVLLSGNLWTLLIREQPIDRINSINDLYAKIHWENSEIYFPIYFDFYETINYPDSVMFWNFKNRSKLFNPIELFLVPNSADKFGALLKLVFETNSVLTLNNLNLHNFAFRFCFPIIH